MPRYKPCGAPGHNKVTHCVEPINHDGFHIYGPYYGPDPKLSFALEEVKRLLICSCPDWQIEDIKTPRLKCCPFHNAAKVVHDTQIVLRKVGQ